MRSAQAGVRPFSAASGALLALSAAPFAVVPAQWAAAAVLPSICLLSAGLVIVQKPRPGRVLATMGMVGMLGSAGPLLSGNPALALAAWIVALAGMGSLWDVLGRPGTRRPLLAGRAYGAAMAALLFWTTAALVRPLHPLLETIPVAVGFVIAAVTGFSWALAGRREFPGRAAVVLSAAGVAAAVGFMAAPAPWPVASAGAVYAVVAVLALPRVSGFEVEPLGWWEPLLGHPERLLVGTFLGLSALGSVLLALPVSAAGDSGAGLLDAAFTAVSAVCVTGLIVLDTPVDFSFAGQAVILALIQVGGLGIMTFSTAVLRVMGRRMSLRHEGAAASLISVRDRGQLVDSTRRILRLTLVAESLGAALLLPGFLAQGDAPLQAVWRAVFTSVSAFCNAGFALQSDNLVGYQTNPLVLHVVALLIIVGGLSPVAVYAMPSLVRRRARPVPVQARLGLIAAGVLLAGGFLLLTVFEWDHALAHLSWADRLHNAWFQSVTLRTAGFNSLDFALLQPASLSLAMVWMFIGGGPGGTAGGIKTTTVAVLVLSVIQIVKGSPRVGLFGRHLGEGTRHRAAAVAILAAATVIGAVVALQLTQALPGVEALFEVVSALGTVGLSIGATARLDEIGKVIVMVCMFVGRVGGLSLLMFMSQRGTPSMVVRLEEEIDVG
jgi:trk system potassium uptake protein TrkH